MMRALLLAAATLVSAPALAQDHSSHAAHEAPAHGETQADRSMGDADEAGSAAADHSAMDPGTMDQGAMDHVQMDHSAMDHSAMDHGSMDQGAAIAPASGPPPRALEGPAHAADTVFGPQAMIPSRAELFRTSGGWTGATVMFDRLEAKVGKGKDLYLWDMQGWYGGDIDKFTLKSEGEGAFGGEVDKAELQALWSHAIDPWFDLQTGVRYDIEPEGRAHAVLGIQGLAPYMFEVEAAAFLSDRGDLTARLQGEYDQRITQRLILQPRVEVSLAAQDIPRAGIAAGISSIETGLRLRYEIARESAPYIGVGYEAKLGRTADFAHASGEDPDRVSLLFGVRAWF